MPPMSSPLPAKKAGSAETSVNYVAASVYANQTSHRAYAGRGFLSQNAYINQYFLLGNSGKAAGLYTKDLPEGIDFGYKNMNLLPTGLYVASYTKEKNPLTLDDVILSSKAYSGRNENGSITFAISGEKALSGQNAVGDFVSVQEMKNPFSLKAYNIAIPTIYMDDDQYIESTVSKYLYLRKKVSKGKYISRVFVGSYCKEDYTPETKQVNVNLKEEKLVVLLFSFD